MPITGGMKFFNKSQCLLADGASIVSTVSGDAASDFAIDRNPFTKWQSVGSDDTTTETLEITFPEAKTIDRILLLDHNFKQFDIKYDVSGLWTAFTNVVGLDGTLAGITETAFADDSSYYEFDSVTTTKIQINIDKTQTVDAEKYLNQCIVTDELGTLQGYPDFSPSFSNNSRDKRMLSGRFQVQKSLQSFDSKLRFRNYPGGSPYNADLDLMFTLFDRLTPFIIWPCGGRRGVPYFKYTNRSFRLKDAFTCQTQGDIKPVYKNNIYNNPIAFTLNIVEVV